MVAVNETSGATVAQAGGSPNSKEASPTKMDAKWRSAWYYACVHSSLSEKWKF